MNGKITYSICVLAILATFACSYRATANTTSYWNQAGIENFFNGKFEGTALTDDGRVMLGYKMNKKFETTEPYIWDIEYDSKGNLWAGSGNKGILYRIDKDGKSKEAAILPGVGVTAIAIDAKDNVYAATMPGGKIFQISGKDGEKNEYANVNAGYVWDMKFGKDGALYCVTGLPGGAFKIEGEKKVTPLYISREAHLLSMFLDGKGGLYAGTSPEGLVLRVDIKEAEKAFGGMPPALMNFNTETKTAGKEERTDNITKLLEELENGAEAKQSATVDVTGNEEIEETPMVNDKRVKVILDLDEDEAYRLLPMDDGSFLVAANRVQTPPNPQDQKNGGKPMRNEPISFPAGIAASAANGQFLAPARLYKVEPDGRNTMILQIPDPYILSLMKVDSDNILVGTGNEGRLYAMNVTEDTATLQSIEATQILALAGNGPTLRIATGNPANVFSPASSRVEKGSFTSGINDATTSAIYGNLTALADVPEGAALSFSARTGNTSDPDDGTWNGWSEPSDKYPFKIKSDPGRFIQFKTDMTPSPNGDSPTLSEVRIYYITENQAPEIDSFNVLPKPQDRPKPQQQNGGGPQPPAPPQGGPGQQQPSQDNNKVVGSIIASDEIVFRWTASDPDSDTLLATVEYRAIPSSTWIVIEEDYAKSELRWDTDSTPDGHYEARLTVSDRDSNTVARALSDNMTSEPFVVDHNRPVITAFADSGKATVKATIKDATSIVSSVEYSTNNKDWHMAFPDDLIFDNLEESVTIEATPKKGETADTLLIRATDFVGNTGSLTVKLNK